MNILITSYFRASQLISLLNTISSQIEEDDCIYVVYQESDYSTSTELSRFQELPMVTIPFNELGAAAAVLMGMKSMNAAGFLLLDDDVLLPTNYLKRLRELIQDNPGYLIAGTNLVINREVNNDEDVDALIDNGISNAPHRIGVKKKFGYTVGRFQEPFFGPLRPIDHFQGCNVYIPKSEIIPSRKFVGDSIYYELAWSFKLRRSTNMIVKPDLTVLHVQPFDQVRINERSFDSLERIHNASQNMSIAVSEIQNFGERLLTGMWFKYVGQKPIYGALRAFISIFKDSISIQLACKRFFASRRGWRKGISRS